MKRVLIGAIKIYQKTLSLDHGILKNSTVRVCRFEPTCSDFTIQAIEKYGSIKGTTMGVWRIMRCNPWNAGGYDPVGGPKVHPGAGDPEHSRGITKAKIPRHNTKKLKGVN